MKKLRIGVIYGGRSGEHEVSLASAAAVIANLDRPGTSRSRSASRRTAAGPSRTGPPPRLGRRGHRAGRCTSHAPRARRARGAPRRRTRASEHVLTIERTPAATARTRDRRTSPASASTSIFPVLHGPYGEDGTVQGLLELANVPVRRRRRARLGGRHGQGGDEGGLRRKRPADRATTSSSLRRDWRATRGGLRRRVATRLGFPVFVKPANLGSSVGISKAKAPRRSSSAAIDAGRRVRPQDRRRGRRAAARARSSARCSATTRPRRRSPARSCRRGEFYDYEAKYLDDGSRGARSRRRSPRPGARGAAPGGRGVPGGRRAGMARVDFLLARRPATSVPERDQHHSRLHDDQHVPEAVGGERPRVPRAARSADRSSRSSATPRSSGCARASVTAPRPAILARGSSSWPRPAHSPPRTLRRWSARRQLTGVGHAPDLRRGPRRRFEQVEPRSWRSACGPAPREACDLLRARRSGGASSWIPMQPIARRRVPGARRR